VGQLWACCRCCDCRMDVREEGQNLKVRSKQSTRRRRSATNPRPRGARPHLALGGRPGWPKAQMLRPEKSMEMLLSFHSSSHLILVSQMAPSAPSAPNMISHARNLCALSSPQGRQGTSEGNQLECFCQGNEITFRGPAARPPSRDGVLNGRKLSQSHALSTVFVIFARSSPCTRRRFQYCSPAPRRRR
jgi:hypothetical protein